MLLGFGFLFAGCGGRYPKPLPREIALQRLEKSGSEYSQNAFVRTAEKGDVDRISLYLDAGIDPNGKDDNGTTAIYAAASRQHDDAIRLLASRGADPKLGQFWTPLDVAGLFFSPSTVRTLLECGADPNQLNAFGEPPAWFLITSQAMDEFSLMQVKVLKVRKRH